jgi:uncharacterized membrane protein
MLTWTELIRAWLSTIADDLKRAGSWLLGTCWTMCGDAVAMVVITIIGGVCLLMFFGAV